MFARSGLLRVMAASLTVLLAACGGGGSTSSAPPPTPVGIYSGTGKFADAAGNDNLMLVESDNTYWLLYTPPSTPSSVIFFDTGTATTTAQTFNATGDTDYTLLYDDPKNSNAIVPSGATAGSVTNGLSVEFDYTFQKQIDGSILNGTTVSSVIVPLYVAGSATMGNVAPAAGKYSGNFSSTLNTSTLQAAGCLFTTALTIGSNGQITGTVDDCTGGALPSMSTVTGSLTARMDINAFDVTLNFVADGGDSMPLDGLSFTGIAYYDSTGKFLYIAALTADKKDAIGFAAAGPN